MITHISSNHFHYTSISLDAGKWSDSRLGRFTPTDTAPISHCIGGWVDPRPRLDVMKKIKILSLPGISNPDSSIVQPVAKLSELICHPILKKLNSMV
jgi:hypothetical protein